MEDIIRAALYLRRSREEEDNPEETLDNHREILLEHAKKNNILIIENYEEVASGSSLFGRPEMQRLLNNCDKGTFNSVLCMDIDRLTRGAMSEQGLILERLKSTHILIVTPNKTYDLNNDLDETFSEFKTFMARQEYKMITKRLQVGAKKTIEDGYHLFEPPFGYRRVYEGKHPTLEIVPDEAEIVKLIFDMYSNQGFGAEIISQRLNSMGSKPRKNIKWSRNSVRYTLKNATYAGKIVYNRTKWMMTEQGKRKVRKYLPKKEWIYVDGLHPAIIENELYEKAQTIREGKYHPPAYTGEIKNPFAGLLFCNKCGRSIIRQHRNKTDKKCEDLRYRCPEKSCCASVSGRVLEAAILKQLKDFNNISILTALKGQEENFSEITLTHAKEENAQLKTQQSKLYDLLERGIYTEEVFLERMDDITKRLKANNELIAEASNVPQILTAQEVATRLDLIIKEWDTMYPIRKNNLLKQIVKKILYVKEDRDSELRIVLFIR